MTPTERIQVPHTCAVDNDCAACKAICAAQEASDQRQVVVLRKENASLRGELAAATKLNEAERAVVEAALVEVRERSAYSILSRVAGNSTAKQEYPSDQRARTQAVLDDRATWLLALRAQVKP